MLKIKDPPKNEEVKSAINAQIFVYTDIGVETQEGAIM